DARLYARLFVVPGTHRDRADRAGSGAGGRHGGVTSAGRAWSCGGWVLRAGARREALLVRRVGAGRGAGSLGGRHRGAGGARGGLRLGILMETMRREGYEFQVSRPRIIPREGPNGERLEPYEELMIDCPEGYLGVVMEKLGPRRAELLDMKNPGVGMVRMRFKIPARGMLGYRSEFMLVA